MKTKNYLLWEHRVFNYDYNNNDFDNITELEAKLGTKNTTIFRNTDNHYGYTTINWLTWGLIIAGGSTTIIINGRLLIFLARKWQSYQQNKNKHNY